MTSPTEAVGAESVGGGVRAAIRGTVESPGSASAISPGGYQTCAVTAAGAAKCWGYNGNGQLGNGTTTDSSVPVTVTGLGSGVQSISAGGFFTCALTVQGAVKCWGANDARQLGNGSAIAYSSLPVQVAGLGGGVHSIAAGGEHACAITAAGGAAKCWGNNGYGQLGNGTFTTPAVPVHVIQVGNGVQSIAAGGEHSCAITASGAVKCWGLNNNGQLGNGTNSNSTTPVPVYGVGNNVHAITAGAGHSCAITAPGLAKCWGTNLNGQFGNGTTTNSSVAVPVSGLGSGVQAIAGGNVHTCAVTAAGVTMCWGFNGYGQLGNGTTTDSLVPVAVTGL